MLGSFTLLTNGMTDIDQRVRIAVFSWLDEQVSIAFSDAEGYGFFY